MDLTKFVRDQLPLGHAIGPRFADIEALNAFINFDDKVIVQSIADVTEFSDSLNDPSDSDSEQSGVADQHSGDEAADDNPTSAGDPDADGDTDQEDELKSPEV